WPAALPKQGLPAAIYGYTIQILPSSPPRGRANQVGTYHSRPYNPKVQNWDKRHSATSFSVAESVVGEIPTKKTVPFRMLRFHHWDPLRDLLQTANIRSKDYPPKLHHCWSPC